MRLRRFPIATAVTLMLLSTSSSRAGIIITILQSGPNVVATGSGSIDLTGLTLEGPSPVSTGVSGSEAIAAVGPASPFSGITPNVTFYLGATGPTSFGTGTYTTPTSATGVAFGVDGGTTEIGVPVGYTSGTTISGTSTFSGETIGMLGLTPGTYTYTWDGGGTDHTLQVQIGTAAVVHEPSTAILAVSGAAAFLAYGWSRHRREQRRQAAA
jgi:hypothetical protein